MKILDILLFVLFHPTQVEYQNPLRIIKREDWFGMIAFTPIFALLLVTPAALWNIMIVFFAVLYTSVFLSILVINNNQGSKLPLWALFVGSTINFEISELEDFIQVRNTTVEKVSFGFKHHFGELCDISVFNLKGYKLDGADRAIFVDNIRIIFLKREEALITKLSI